MRIETNEHLIKLKGLEIKKILRFKNPFINCISEPKRHLETIW